MNMLGHPKKTYETVSRYQYYKIKLFIVHIQIISYMLSCAIYVL